MIFSYITIQYNKYKRMKRGFLLGKQQKQKKINAQTVLECQTKKKEYESQSNKSERDNSNTYSADKSIYEQQSINIGNSNKNTSEQSFHQQIRKMYLDQIAQYIIDVVVRNQTYKANFIHFLIPFALIAKSHDLSSGPKQKTYLKALVVAIIQKLKLKQKLKLQLENKSFYDDFMILIANPEPTQSEILKYLRKFLIQNKEIMIGVMPYYYNFFALLVNKQIIFLGQKQELLQYSVDMKQEFYEGKFSRKQICQSINILQKKLAEKYHSKDI